MCFALFQGSAYYRPTNTKMPTAVELGACGFLPTWLFHYSVPSNVDGLGSEEQWKENRTNGPGSGTRHSSAITESCDSRGIIISEPCFFPNLWNNLHHVFLAGE